MAVSAPDRLRSLLDALLEGIESGDSGAALARRAYLSRYHFDRLVAAALRESPGALRRRLLLERAAYELASGDRPVTEIAFDAGYGSLEAFTRAFGRAYGHSPSRFRRAPRSIRLEAPNGVHFHPPAGLFLPAGRERRHPMDLTDRMLEHDAWLTEHLVDAAARLPDEALDEPKDVLRADRFVERPTIRAYLDRLVASKEIWAAAIAGRALADERDTSLPGLRARHEAAAGEFAEIVRGIRDRGAWDDAFVDALCDPPETFTFGGAVNHVLTWSASRRQLLVAALREHGVDAGSGDPIEWERAVA